MKNKELIELITELKQQLDESRDTDFDNYVGKLSKRASKVISELEVDDVVLDDVINGFYDWHKGKGYITLKRDDLEEYLNSLKK